MEISSNGSLYEKRLAGLMRHINHVRDSCMLLGQRLSEEGETEFGRALIANGMIHDNSKFRGIEWLYLHDDVKITDSTKFLLALEQHRKTNPHHPEYTEWGCIHAMPRLYLAEMVCDWHARSSEFGTSLRDWVKAEATKHYGMQCSDKTYKQIKHFLNLLLDKGFK